MLFSTVVRAPESHSRVSGSKPQGGSKVDSAFHPSEVDQMSTGNSGGLSAKSKLSPRSGSVALRLLNSIHKIVL